MRCLRILCLAVPVVAAADARAETPAGEEEYPAFRIGTTLGLPANLTSGALTAAASSAAGLNLDALVKAGFALSERYARVFFLSESTQLPVPSVSQVDMASTQPLETDTFFGALGAKLTFGSPHIDPVAHQTCCAAIATGLALNASQKQACTTAQIVPPGTTACSSLTPPEASTLFWGVGFRILSPRSGKVGNIGAAAELYAQLRTDHVDGFLSASGVALQGWTDDVDMVSAIKHGSVLQGTAAFGFRYSFRGVHVGALGRLGCQKSELSDRISKACSGEGGVHVSVTNVTDKAPELRFYAGVERSAGADRLMAAGVQDNEYAFVFRIEPALTSMLK
jgi:hypothetical protein